MLHTMMQVARCNLSPRLTHSGWNLSEKRISSEITSSLW
ncbi:hypothetical protein FGIG_01700 [Fasciola gigantica]|uniref:Uncharacterized protein n=1 Tax=Fasciola gigantica TaxID=46835 RepID=A0A504YCN8_FASGI|nr:hypothetical protein FGIG_01700 [Fasciola gigantica]